MTESEAAPLGSGEVDALHDRFAGHLKEAVAEPVLAALDRYVDELRRAVDSVAELAPDVPEPRDAPDPAASPAADADPNVRSEAESDPEGEVARSAAEERFRYAERFGARFGSALFEASNRARRGFFDELTRAVAAEPPLPETVEATNRDAVDPAPELVRPRWPRRLATALKRPRARTIPVRALADAYQAELSRRLVRVANDVARLLAVALAEIRDQLHEHTDLGGNQDDAPALDAVRTSVADEIERLIEEADAGFGRALRARAVDLPERDRLADIRAGAAGNRDDLLADWAAFESTLMANVSAETVLARGLAAMEAAVAAAARDIEHARDAHGVEPMERLADGLSRLGDQGEEELAEKVEPDVLEALAEDAMRLFADETPRVGRLRATLEARAEALVERLAEVPDLVPDDIQLSESPVTGIPDRAGKLELRDAPLEDLLSTACKGTLPRWLEKSLAVARDEVEAMDQELARMRKAVEFQLRAPLRGGFSDLETVELVTGIAERAAGQFADLRGHGLEAIDTLVDGLEERAGEEADTLRSTVANREFFRIHSEIAEEQAVRRLSTVLERVRALAAAIGHGARNVWDASGRLVAAVQAWAQRQLGVGEVEREAMVESLEQSLLGADQRVVDLPPMYRQLFDVEADVPWDELLVARDEEIEVIQRAYDRWSEDRSSTVAIVGEKGSGKSTLVRLARERVFGETVIREVELGGTIDDPAELDDRLNEAFELDGGRPLVDAIRSRDPCVAVVEDLHHLFIRALGGFNALETFLEVMAATSSNVLWVVTADESAWRYLSRVLGVDVHFVHQVSTTNLSRDRLEQAIMARHEVSGFSLRFETGDDEPRNSRWARILGREEPGELARKEPGELARKETRRRRFFQELAAIAEGNIVMGLFYWLRSIDRTEDHVLVLGQPRIIDLEFLERIPLPHLHTIAATILHGGISHATHQRIFQIPAAESRLQLAALAASHMIFLADDGEYKINKVLYRPFLRLLVSKNIF